VWIDRPDEWPGQRLKLARELCDIELSPEVHAALAEQRGTIFEGDDILPEFAAQMVARGAKAAFLLETDEDVLFERAARRNQSGRTLNAARRRSYVRGHALYAAALLRDARRLGLPVVESLPFETQLERLGAALGLDL
jgi:2-phosphoglycerate kinase